MALAVLVGLFGLGLFAGVTPAGAAQLSACGKTRKHVVTVTMK
jgi:hypothetical protein